ncbi:GNAT family N-acetyltransferase [Pseudonocardia ailaonensis]|uniref:GNAT family N-acetyltransferase n=1 Tax=Pseudonocardia ailaonensis TaxID=367279 RepID=A0ABN2NB26_9PSEU
MSLTVSLLPAHRRDEAGELWRRVEAGLATPALAAGWTWTSTWLEHFGDVVPHRFLVAYRGDEPVATTLVTFSRTGPRVFPRRRLHLGTAGEPVAESVFVEYNDLLCAPEELPAVCRAVAAAVRTVPRWDTLTLDGVVPRTAALLGADLGFATRETPSWTVRLDPDRTVMETLGRSTRRLVRQAVEALGPEEPELATEPERAREIFDELVRLHQRRWTAQGEPGAFASIRRHGFVRDVLLRLLAEGRAAVGRLAGADGLIGCVVGWIDDGRFLYYQGGFAQYDEVRKRAGLLGHAVFAEHFRQAGLREYELLAGDAQYKRQLSAGEQNPLVWAEHDLAHPRAVALGGIRVLRDRAGVAAGQGAAAARERVGSARERVGSARERLGSARERVGSARERSS